MADENKVVAETNEGNLLTSRARVVAMFRSAQQRLHRIFQLILTILNPLVVFCSTIRDGVRYSHSSLRQCLVYIHAMLHFDYRSIAESVLEMPKTFYERSKNEARERLWKPVDRSLRFLARHLWRRLQTLKIYCRGLAELSRRLFLLTSDYTPGGKLTVGILLGVLLYLLMTRLLAYMGTLLQLVKFVFNIALFILDPIILTLKDILAAVNYMLSLAFVLLRSVLSIFCSALEKVLYFFGINVAAISTGVYNCWRSFLTSKPVHLLCTLSLSALYNSLDIVVFSVVPVLSKLMLYGSTNAIQVSAFAYSKLAVVRIENYTGEHYSVTSMTTVVFILYAFWITFRLRNTFPPAQHAIVDGYDSIKSDEKSPGERVSSTKTSPVGAATRRIPNKAVGRATKTKTEDDNKGVYIRTGSLDPICSSFLLGNCQRGRLCDGHHCHARYHWQYRSMRGWKSFSDEENHVIERLYCDPNNDVVKTRDVEVALTSYISRHSTPAEVPVKLDFENMKVEKDYRTADLRRLSTESYVKASDVALATRWVWYHQDDEMVWRKYEDDDPNENGRKQEEIEEAFFRRERYHNFSRNGKDYRLYFYMKPMCERSVNYRDNSKRGIRRRPRVIQEEPAEQQVQKPAEQQEEKSELSFWQKWSPLRVLTWR